MPTCLIHKKRQNSSSFFAMILAKIFHLDILTEFWDNRILREHRQYTEKYERRGKDNDARWRWTEPKNRFG